MVKVGLLSALSIVLMYTLNRIPFPPAPFLKFDVSMIPALYAGYAISPLSAVVVVMIRCLAGLPVSTTSGIGVLAHFLVGTAFVLPAALVYSRRHSFGNAVIGLILGIIAGTALAMLSNYFLLLPLYMAGITHDRKMDLIISAILPFNLINLSIQAAATLLTYKKLSPLLHR